MPRKFILALLAGCALAPGLAHAQASAQVDSLTVTAKAATVNLQTTEAVGSRLNMTSLETPASVYAISGDDIRNRGELGLVDAVARAPGFTYASGPSDGGVAYTARGFAGVNSVMALFDGIQELVGQGTVTFPFDDWTTDRVEVLSGPASVLYGTGALGGTVNVVPRRPVPGLSQTTIRVGGGSYDTYRLAADSTGALTDKLGYRVAAQHVGSQGWMDRSSSKTNAASVSLRYDVTPNFNLVLSDDYGRQNPLSNNTPLVNGQIDTRLIHKNYNVSDAYTLYEDNYLTLKANWTVNDHVQAHASAFVITAQRDWHGSSNGLTYLPATDSVLRNVYQIYRQQHQQAGVKSDVSYDSQVAGHENNLVAGVDYDYLRFKRTAATPTQTITSPASLPDPGVFIAWPVSYAANTFAYYIGREDKVSVFAEDRLKFGDKFALVGGLRAEHYAMTRFDGNTQATSGHNYDPLSWRLGGVYNFTPNTVGYAQYSNAVVSVASLVSLSAAQQKFTLTHGDQVEIGAKTAFADGRGQATIAAYQIVQHDLLATDPANANNQLQIGQQSARGVEATVSYAFTKTFTVTGNAALLNARYDNFAEVVGGVRVSRSGNRPANIPNQTANIQASWNVLPKLQLQATGRYVGNRFGDTANLRPIGSYTTLDAGIRYALTPKLSLDGHIYNATDRLYVLTGGGSTTAYLAPPRRFEISLTATF